MFRPHCGHLFVSHVTIVHAMGSHIVRTLRALYLYNLAWRLPQCGRNM